MDPHCFDADPEPDPDPAQNLDADLDPDPNPDPGGGGARSAQNVHPPCQNPRYAPGSIFIKSRKNRGWSTTDLFNDSGGRTTGLID